MAITPSERPYYTTSGAYSTLPNDHQYTVLENLSEYGDNFNQYLNMLRQPFFKICRLRFLNPDGSVAFAMDNNVLNKRNKAFIADGQISVNLQNGQRRTATIILDNTNEEFAYEYGKLWFGQEIALDEGLILPDGTNYYIQQGVFVISDPSNDVRPEGNTMHLNLVDKWANLDGSLRGNLEGTYEVKVGTNVFEPIAELLSEDRGNGLPLDNITPIFTNYYNGKTQTLVDGSVIPMTITPYTLTVEGGSTKAEVILGLTGMLNAWVGYDPSGALRVDPSQDDIADITKPISWSFGTDETTLLGMTYEIKKSEVYNDVIIVGASLENYTQPMARATNLDPASDTNVNLVGRITYREEQSGFATKTQCKDLAVWKLKRMSVLQKAVTISCSQLMHIRENELVEIKRTDKEGSPVERHLVQGFSRPLVGTSQMTINAVSVVDIPNITVKTTSTLTDSQSL